MLSIVHSSASEFPHFPLVRYPLLRWPRAVGAVSATPLPPPDKAAAERHNPCAAVFRPFFTVFDRFSGRAKSKFPRRIKDPTVFAGCAAVKKTAKTVKTATSELTLWSHARRGGADSALAAP